MVYIDRGAKFYGTQVALRVLNRQLLLSHTFTKLDLGLNQVVLHRRDMMIDVKVYLQKRKRVKDLCFLFLLCLLPTHCCRQLYSHS